MGCFGLALCMLGLGLGLAEKRIDPEVKRFMDSIRRCKGFDSTALNFVLMDAKNGQIYRDVSHSSQNQFNGNSVLCIGGATKAFTGVLLYKLLDANENYTIDTPIQDILGRRVVLPDFYRSDNINLKDIMAMRSGLSGMDIVPIAHPYDRERLERNLRYAPVVAPFREKVIHNDVLFALLEEVIEELGGDTYASLLNKHIFTPLKMGSTYVFKADQNIPYLYPGEIKYTHSNYPLNKNVYSGLELIGPAAGICTSASDMEKWMRNILRPQPSQTGISEELLKETFKTIFHLGDGDDPRTKGYRMAGKGFGLPVDSYVRDGRAFGWITGTYRGYTFVSQDGSLPGYHALATFVPEKGLGVFVSFTGEDDDTSFAAKVLMNQASLDLLSRYQANEFLKSKEICDTLSDMVKLHKQPERHRPFSVVDKAIRPFPDYEGIFRNHAFGELRVMFNQSGNGRLGLSYGKGKYNLDPVNQNDTFLMVAQSGHLWHTSNSVSNIDNDQYVVFSADPRDPEGRISEVEIAGFDKHHDPVFAINPRAPHIEGQYQAVCSASGVFTTFWAILLLAAIVLLR